MVTSTEEALAALAAAVAGHPWRHYRREQAGSEQIEMG